MEKNVFVVFAHGTTTLTKIRKICETLGATIYPVDADVGKRQQAIRDVHIRLQDLNHVRRHVLRYMASWRVS